MHSSNAVAGPSRLRKPRQPFVSADYKPVKPDGIFRVVIISSGSVASIKIPEIVGALSKDPNVAVQVVATTASLHFYKQVQVDEAVRAALKQNKSNGVSRERHEAIQVDGEEDEVGVRVWKDADEWSDWKKVGDPILHIELRRWADLVVVAPCSADMLAKIAGGQCDNLATSLLRALSPSTPTILCPAMNTHMYQHPLTADHLHVAQEKLGYMVSGPQGAGRLACGDEGPGKMTDWRDIVSTILDFAAMYRAKTQHCEPDRPLQAKQSQGASVFYPDAKAEGWALNQEAYLGTGPAKPNAMVQGSAMMPSTLPTQQEAPKDNSRPKTPPTPGMDAKFKAGLKEDGRRAEDISVDHWRSWTGNGNDGAFWDKRWWMG